MTKDFYIKPLLITEMFLVILNNGEFLMYAEFDGRLIEIKSRELYLQNKFQNRALIAGEQPETTKHRKREGVFHAWTDSNDILVVSNGFDYEFYKIEFPDNLKFTQNLILEKNIAFENEMYVPNEFPKHETYIDPYDNEVMFKFNLKDDLFLNPARLLPRCKHLLTYGYQTHVPSMVKKAILDY